MASRKIISGSRVMILANRGAVFGVGPIDDGGEDDADEGDADSTADAGGRDVFDAVIGRHVSSHVP